LQGKKQRVVINFVIKDIKVSDKTIRLMECGANMLLRFGLKIGD
jgi:hypothetical protein